MRQLQRGPNRSNSPRSIASAQRSLAPLQSASNKTVQSLARSRQSFRIKLSSKFAFRHLPLGRSVNALYLRRPAICNCSVMHTKGRVASVYVRSIPMEYLGRFVAKAIWNNERCFIDAPFVWRTGRAAALPPATQIVGLRLRATTSQEYQGSQATHPGRHAGPLVEHRRSSHRCSGPGWCFPLAAPTATALPIRRRILADGGYAGSKMALTLWRTGVR